MDKGQLKKSRKEAASCGLRVTKGETEISKGSRRAAKMKEKKRRKIITTLKGSEGLLNLERGKATRRVSAETRKMGGGRGDGRANLPHRHQPGEAGRRERATSRSPRRHHLSFSFSTRRRLVVKLNLKEDRKQPEEQREGGETQVESHAQRRSASETSRRQPLPSGRTPASKWESPAVRLAGVRAVVECVTRGLQRRSLGGMKEQYHPTTRPEVLERCSAAASTNGPAGRRGLCEETAVTPANRTQPSAASGSQ